MAENSERSPAVNRETRTVLALLVHSPLVGPSTLQPLAEELEVLGWRTVVPDLRGAIGSPQGFAVAACDVAWADLVVGHSGAGAFLPLVAESTGAGATVYVDAVLPDVDGHSLASDDFIAFLDQLDVVDGLLPPWNEWWAPDVMPRLVPDDERRRQLVDEIVRLPRSFYDATIELPHGWPARPAAYLQLSPAYDAEAARARRWGWLTVRVDGQHLDVVVRPGVIARHVDGLARELLSATER
jgi:hypothetical protein